MISTMIVSLPTDNDDYTGRECPACERFFKVKFGTGLPGSGLPCHCPYCNQIADHDQFYTKQQLEYINSVALNEIEKTLFATFKKLERKPDPRAFVSLSIKFNGTPTPIFQYSEDELEERVTCKSCTLEYTIYGAFGYCPDCGIHNSLQILLTNYDMIEKILDLANAAPAEVQSKLIENALEDAISNFDGFGRQQSAQLPQKISFQNIGSAKDKLLRDHGVDISASFDKSDWDFVCEEFQKRHLLAHKMGIVDQDYVAKTGRPTNLIGRKVSITDEEVRRLITKLKIVAINLYSGIART